MYSERTGCASSCVFSAQQFVGSAAAAKPVVVIDLPMAPRGAASLRAQLTHSTDVFVHTPSGRRVSVGTTDPSSFAAEVAENIRESHFVAPESDERVLDFAFDQRTGIEIDFQRMPPELPELIVPAAWVRINIARKARGIHGIAGTTGVVDGALQRLSNGAPIIQIAHQPNLLMGLNIASMAFAAASLAKLVREHGHAEPVVGFRLMDTDAAGDVRFSSGALPHWNGSEAIRLERGIKAADRRRFGFAPRPPAAAVVSRWVLQLRQNALEIGRVMRRAGLPVASSHGIRQTADYVGEILTTSYRMQLSATEAAGVVTSRLLNEMWGLKTIIFPASQMLPVIAPDVTNALVRHGAELRRDALWQTCNTCYERVPVTFEFSGRPAASTGPHRHTLSGSGRSGIGFSSTFATPMGELPVFTPKVALCDILDLEVYRFDGEITYAGGIEHVARSRLRHYLTYGETRRPFIWEPRSLLVEPTSQRLRSLDLRPEMIEGLQRGKFPAVLYACLSPGGRVEFGDGDPIGPMFAE